LRELVAFSGVDAVVLDFAVWRKDTASQSLHFPPELVAKAGALGLGLEVSVYVAADS
jgi:hypothetical protein